MPELPEELFLESIRELVAIDRDWIPHGRRAASTCGRSCSPPRRSSACGRPAEYMFLRHRLAGRRLLQGRRRRSRSGSPSDYTRAAPGGTGAAKCGGNYAASLVAQAEAIAHGCDQVVFLDAAEHQWVEELGGMNLFFVLDDGTLVTPPLTGTILPGITRDIIHARPRRRAHRGARGALHARPVARGRRQSGGCARPSPAAPPRWSPRSARSARPTGEFTVGDGGPGELTRRCAPSCWPSSTAARRTRTAGSTRSFRGTRRGPAHRVGPLLQLSTWVSRDTDPRFDLRSDVAVNFSLPARNGANR